MATPATEHDITAIMPPATQFELPLDLADDGRREDGLPELPDGWQHATVVRWLADAPATRREAIFPVVFCLVALLWAPIGVVAAIAGTAHAFLGLSLVLAAVVLVPRPTGMAALGDLMQRLRPAARMAADRARAMADRARAEVGPVVRQLAERARLASAELRRAAGPALTRTRVTGRRLVRTARRRVVAFVADFQAAGERAGQVSAPSGLTDPLSRWLEGQSRPSSTR